MRIKKQTQDLIVEAPCSNSKVEMTIGIDLGDVGVITARSPRKVKS
jgi:hypothetical protein